ncbi:MAG: ABC transporter ATP-binding protein [Variibacter sp.]
MTGAEDLIVIEDVVKTYGAVPALKGVSLRIRRGEFLSMLGPSGCGKTTLLRAIAGFLDPTSGVITIGGKRMNGVPPHRRPVNTVFQNYALFPHMTVAENIAFGPKRAGKPRADITRRVGEVLDTVGMANFAGRYPRELSGGQQQRIALARAIINEPRVLLLDEPLGALDLKLRKRMQTELKRLHQLLGITFVYVTHDQEEALAMSDRIAVMSHGEIVQLGTGQEIYSNPVSRYVADFIGEANLINCVVDADKRLRLTADAAPLPYTAETDGSATSLMIRPEAIRLGAINGASDAVGIDGKLRDKIFVGQTWRLFVEIATGQEVTLEPGWSPDIEALKTGDHVSVWWPRARARVLNQ